MSETEHLAKALRGLAIAVWFLCGLTAAQLGFALWGWFRPQTFSSFQSPMPASPADGISSGQMKEDNEFSAYPPEEKVRRASMILVVEYRRDGDRMKALITEIVKKKPDTRFYYSVGNEFNELSQALLASALRVTASCFCVESRDSIRSWSQMHR